MTTLSDVAVRKLVMVREEVLAEGGKADAGAPLIKVAALATIANPYVGRPLSPELEELVAPSAAVGTLLGERAVAALDAPVESYGQAALVGLAGEQEHAAACLAGAFGDAFRETVGGGLAWLPSVTKRCTAGEAVDVPLAFKDELWVGSHYDTITVRVPDAPAPDEIVVIAAVASRGRLHARLGGLSKQEALAAVDFR
jgi:Amino acid synthesis